MVEIKKPSIECIENPQDESYGKYVVEPLERGCGTTLGNSLRRVLLSSLPGTAVTAIKIAGIQHEFATIPGVKNATCIGMQETNSNDFIVEPDGLTDVRRAIFARLSERKWPILLMQSNELSLEQIFLRLTDKDVKEAE